MKKNNKMKKLSEYLRADYEKNGLESMLESADNFQKNAAWAMDQLNDLYELVEEENKGLRSVLKNK